MKLIYKRDQIVPVLSTQLQSGLSSAHQSSMASVAVEGVRSLHLTSMVRSGMCAAWPVAQTSAQASGLVTPSAYTSAVVAPLLSSGFLPALSPRGGVVNTQQASQGHLIKYTRAESVSSSNDGDVTDSAPEVNQTGQSGQSGVSLPAVSPRARGYQNRVPAPMGQEGYIAGSPNSSSSGLPVASFVIMRANQVTLSCVPERLEASLYNRPKDTEVTTPEATVGEGESIPDLDGLNDSQFGSQVSAQRTETLAGGVPEPDSPKSPTRQRRVVQ